MTTPQVRVGIVSWNTASHLDACLAALPAALDGLEAEVIVVDNASRDGSVGVAHRYPVTVIRNDTNRGYAVAMNQALRYDTGSEEAPVLLALNPDTVPGPGTLKQLAERLRAQPDAGLVVPRLVDEAGRHQHSAYRFPGPLAPIVAAASTSTVRRGRLGRSLLLEGSGPHPGGPVDWAIGAVHMIRASVLGGEQPYSERSFMYAEDLDLCWRLAQRGAPTVLAADVVIAHVGNVAGHQAWGAERSVRYWAASYDVIAQRRSSAAARLTALGATVATIVSIARLAPRAVTGQRSGRARDQIRLRRRELAAHIRTLISGPGPPPVDPPSEDG